MSGGEDKPLAVAENPCRSKVRTEKGRHEVKVREEPSLKWIGTARGITKAKHATYGHWNAHNQGWPGQ